MQSTSTETKILNNILLEMLKYERLDYGLLDLSETRIIKVCTNFNSIYPNKLALSYLKLGAMHLLLKQVDLAISSYKHAFMIAGRYTFPVS